MSVTSPSFAKTVNPVHNNQRKILTWDTLSRVITANVKIYTVNGDLIRISSKLTK